MTFFRRHSSPQGSGWQPMSSAPRDGTVVELVCTYGIAPWYGRHRWTGESVAFDNEGKAHTFTGEPQWYSVDKPGYSVSDEDYLQWRPCDDGTQYTDPTKGAQDTREYWLRAMGR